MAATERLDHELPDAALALARVFSNGGRLLVAAPDRPDHAHHVAVEFIHPAITGARPLPAFAVSVDRLSTEATITDAVLLIESPDSVTGARIPRAELTMRLPGVVSDTDVVRWYHVLWELVQIALEHPGLSGGEATAGGDSTGFLYPFLDATETDLSALKLSMSESAHLKRHVSHQLTEHVLVANADTLAQIAIGIRRRIQRGGHLYAIGNGGSACDAAQLVRALRAAGDPASSLMENPAVITALANDVGAENIFSRQLEAGLRADDILVIFSTSGSSQNLMRALDLAATGAALVITCSGYDGGPIARHEHVDHALIVDSSSVHRIQEAQSAMIQELSRLLGSMARTNVEVST